MHISGCINQATDILSSNPSDGPPVNEDLLEEILFRVPTSLYYKTHVTFGRLFLLKGNREETYDIPCPKKC